MLIIKGHTLIQISVLHVQLENYDIFPFFFKNTDSIKGITI